MALALIKFYLGTKIGLGIVAFAAVFLAMIVIAIGDMNDHTERRHVEQRRVIQQQVDDSHKLRAWRMK